MEGKFTFRSNASGNETQVTTRKYIFAPVSQQVKIVLVTVMIFIGLYGLIANSLILYFKHKEHKRRRHTMHTLGRSVKEYFINSLALSDVLCSLISLPVFAAEMFIDFVHNDWICKFNRFLNIAFPIITILNLLVIGVERYVANFHPLFKPSRSKAKKLVIGAWVLGTLGTAIQVLTYNRIHYNIGENMYTLVCKYDNSKVVYQGLFVGGACVIYILPSFILVVVKVRILRYIRRYKTIEIRYDFGRLKATQMFVSIIFAFIIPYSAFVLYTGVNFILKPTIPFAVDYVTRFTSGFLAMINGATSATILFHNERILRRMFFDIFYNVSPRSCRVEVTPKRPMSKENEQAQSENNIQARRQTDGPAVITSKL